MHKAAEEMLSSSAGYVRCMQRLMEDIYNKMKEAENK